MSQLEILPVIDTEVLKVKANEAALKGALKEIEEYYTGYNSPYRKAIKEELEKKEINQFLTLPDIISLINEKLSNEIDVIANTAVTKSFLPLVSQFLVRENKEINFSDILKMFIESMDGNDPYEYSANVEKHREYGWLNVNLNYKGNEYKMTFHEDWDTRNKEVQKYHILSLPHKHEDYKNTKQTMKIKVEGGEGEIPFIRDVLSDRFTSYIARLVMSKSNITMDVTDFQDEFFPRDECHCHD